MTTEPRSPEKPATETSSPASSVAVLHSQQIFQGQREIWIEHAGVRYRLRITRRNKLILQK
jgi:hemin uptake protein HemP